MDASEFWNVVVIHRTSRATFGDVSHVFDQILFTTWTGEEIWQAEHCTNANVLGMLSQFVHICDGTAANLDHADHVVFAAAFYPLFGYTFAFVDTQAGSFASYSIDQDTRDFLSLQPVSVFVDYVEFDHFSGQNEK